MSTTSAHAGRRLLFLAEGADPRKGGQERSIVELGLSLLAGGFPVRLVRGEAGPPSGLEEETIEPRGRTRASRVRDLLDRMEDRAARDPSEIAVGFLPLRTAAFYFPRGGLYRMAFRRSAESRPQGIQRLVAAALTPWEPRRRVLLQREREALMAPHGPVLLALSTMVAAHARDEFGLPDPRIRIVRNGVDVSRIATSHDRGAARAALGLPADATVFLALAHNPRLKGIPELIRSFVALGDPATRLVIAGRGHPPLLPEHVIHLGPREDVATLYKAADVLVHPTWYDPSSRVVLEALAAGLPVITTRWNGAAEDVGEAGIILDGPDDTRALAGALARMTDPDARTRCIVATHGMGRTVATDRSAHELRAALGLGAPEKAATKPGVLPVDGLDW